MDARPDQEGMEQAINKCQLNPCSGQESVSLISVAEAMAAGFLPALDEDQADMFTPLELRLPLACCTDTLRTTGYKPGISWVIPVSLVISLVNP